MYMYVYIEKCPFRRRKSLDHLRSFRLAIVSRQPRCQVTANLDTAPAARPATGCEVPRHVKEPRQQVSLTSPFIPLHWSLIFLSFFRMFSDYLHFKRKGASAGNFHGRCVQAVKSVRGCLEKSSWRECAFSPGRKSSTGRSPEVSHPLLLVPLSPVYIFHNREYVCNICSYFYRRLAILYVVSTAFVQVLEKCIKFRSATMFVHVHYLGTGIYAVDAICITLLC